MIKIEGAYIMVKKTLILYTLILFSFGFSQDADLVTQKIKLENAMRDKVDFTLSKQLDPTQYLIVVNARLDFKPLSLNAEDNLTTKKQENSSYTFIPGLDMPSIPTDQTIYKANSSSGLSGYKYSSSLLYGMEIIIYLDEAIATASLQQNLKTLVQRNVPEIVDCTDCIKFETLDMLNSGVPTNSINDRIAALEAEKNEAEKELQNWRFNQLEEQLAVAQDARNDWEEQARNRENIRRIDDSTRMANLEKIEKLYRQKQDSLLYITSIKLDEAIRGRISSEESTKEELINIIKLSMQGGGDSSNSNTPYGLGDRRPLGTGNITGKHWVIIILVVILSLVAYLVIAMKNQQPVYLKPKSSPDPNNNNNNSNDEDTGLGQPTQAHTTDDVLRSELQSLRQSAVSMSVSEKAGANQIVKDWLDNKVDDGSEDNSNNEE